MKKLVLVISSVAIMLASVTSFNLIGSPVEASEDTIKIMCIGDSITDGYTNDYIGSYRKFIYHDLTEMGYNIDMVGSKGSGWTPTYIDSETDESFEFDNDNTGYSGYSIINYNGRSGIYETLQSTNCLISETPDIVTLQIGTNDIIDNYEIDSAGERLEILVDYILENIPENSALFVTTIPELDPNRSDVYSWFGNYRHSADWQIQYTDDEAEAGVAEAVKDYNAQIKSLVEDKKSEGAEIYFADINSVITDVKIQLFDGVHPNNTGYKAMGNYWSGILDGYISSKEIVPPVSETTATTATSITTTKTTTETIVTTDVTTTTEYMTTSTDNDEGNGTFRISDLVKLSYYVLGCPAEIHSCTPEEIKVYDLDRNGKNDVYDVILMRQSVIRHIENNSDWTEVDVIS